MLGLRFCARALSSCSKRGPLFIAVRRPLTVTASLVVEHRLQTCRLSSCGSRAYLLCGMWDLPRPGLKPVSPALAGGFSTTAPPGKPNFIYECLVQFWNQSYNKPINWFYPLFLLPENILQKNYLYPEYFLKFTYKTLRLLSFVIVRWRFWGQHNSLEQLSFNSCFCFF